MNVALCERQNCLSEWSWISSEIHDGNSTSVRWTDRLDVKIWINLACDSLGLADTDARFGSTVLSNVACDFCLLRFLFMTSAFACDEPMLAEYLQTRCLDVLDIP